MVGAFAEFESQRAILRERIKADWMLPVSGLALEGVVQNSDPFHKMK